MTALEQMTRDELVERAQSLGLEVRKDQSKAALREAIAGASPPPPAARVADGEPLTAEQRAKLALASEEQIEAVLADSALPLLWRSAFESELAGRRSRAQESGLRSKIEEWVVTTGGRYFIPGYATTLPEGSVISAMTHDLDTVRAQGIEIRRLQGEVVIVIDQLGFARTKIVEESEVAPPGPSGWAPRP
jgi:hypothetical protein